MRLVGWLLSSVCGSALGLTHRGRDKRRMICVVMQSSEASIVLELSM